MQIFSHLKTNSLLIASTVDPASLNIAQSLLRQSNIWKEIEKGKIWLSSSNLQNNNVFLWLQHKPLLQLNYADECFRNELSSSTPSSSTSTYITELCLNQQSFQSLSSSSSSATITSSQSIPYKLDLNDVVFLSKHSAASGIASLTVHPIGIPWTTDIIRNGGLAGRCSPPSFRISSLYRSLMRRVEELNVKDKYQVTLEATHHGPYVNLPTCFAEIGSSENEWSSRDLGEIWSDVLIDHFNLSSSQSSGSSVQEGLRPLASSSSLPLSSSSSSMSSSSSSSMPSSSSSSSSMPSSSSSTPSSSSSLSLSSSSMPSSSSSSSSSSNSPPVIITEGVVMILIGGGHYVPKMNDACRFGEGIYIGHALATYTLQPYFDFTDYQHNSNNHHNSNSNTTSSNSNSSNSNIGSSNASSSTGGCNNSDSNSSSSSVNNNNNNSSSSSNNNNNGHHSISLQQSSISSIPSTPPSSITASTKQAEKMSEKYLNFPVSDTSSSSSSSSSSVIHGVVNGVEGGWKHIVTEAVASTRLTFPNFELICLIDKKAFNARHREAIIHLLNSSSLNVSHTFKLGDVKSLWEKICNNR